jgi:hypothetical protein
MTCTFYFLLTHLVWPLRLLTVNGRQVRVALDARQAVIVTVEYGGFTPAGELRHPVIGAGYRG